MRAPRFATAILTGMLLGLTTTASGARPALAAGTAATDGPGALSHFDLARKDCVGTARNDSSKVWFTVAGGILSDVYSPTVDNTNVETLQLVVTDGATFTDLQSRDTTYTVRSTDRSGMVCEVTSTARSGRYRLVTEDVTDAARDSVVMSTRLKALVGSVRDYQVYVRYDASINGSDGLTQLDASHRLTGATQDALNGNVVQTARVDTAREGRFTLALGFGETQRDAVRVAGASAHAPFAETRGHYADTWHAYDRGLR